MAVVTIIGPNKHMRPPSQTCNTPRWWRIRLSVSLWDVEYWRWRRHIGKVQYVGRSEADEHDSANCFPQSVVSRKITNTSKHPYYTSVGRQKDRVAISIVAGCDKARWLFATCHSGITSPRQSITPSVQCPHAMTGTRVLHRSSYNFLLPIMRFFNPILE